MPLRRPDATAAARLSREFQTTWREFQQPGGVVNSLASWAAGTPRGARYLTYLIPVGLDPRVGEAVSSVQRALGYPFVEPVQLPALHITVQGVDFRDRLSPEQQTALRVAGAQALAEAEPFAVAIRNANSFGDAAILEVHDGGAIRDLRARLRRALPWLAEEDRDRLVRDGRDTFLPHISIAYYNAESPSRPIALALQRFRRLEVAELRVGGVQLVSAPILEAAGHMNWSVEATLELGAGR